MTLRLAVLCVTAVACSSPRHAEEVSRPPAAARKAPAPRCVPAGDYTVRVDLSSAQISQQNTDMADTRWCKSMLEAVPAQSMTSMRIAYPGDQLAVDWAGSRSVTVASECEFEITSPPMPARIRFAQGVGTGTTTYSIGTDNHPDESCSATGARLTIELSSAPPVP